VEIGTAAKMLAQKRGRLGRNDGFTKPHREPTSEQRSRPFLLLLILRYI